MSKPKQPSPNRTSQAKDHNILNSQAGPEAYAFDDGHRSIHIRRLDTPQPWINYLSNGRLHAFVSQAGGGLAWWRSPIKGRLTRYRAFHMPQDGPGFYLYVREEDGSCWSPTLRPCESPVDQREASHRPGYSEFTASRGGLKVRLGLFVAPDEDALVWDVRLENTNPEERRVDVFAYVEFSQLDWEKELKGGYYARHMMKGWFDEKAAAVCFLDHDWEPYFKEKPVAYLLSSENPDSHTTDRDEFFGCYGTEALPRSVGKGSCPGNELSGGNGCGALHRKFVLQGNTVVKCHYALGVLLGVNHSMSATHQALAEKAARLRTRKLVDSQRQALENWWDRHLGAYQAKLPDERVARQINIWSPLNTVQAARYSRAINTWAPGTRGVGFRDTAQDMIAIAYRRPDWAVQSLLFLLSHQYADGHTVHTIYPEDYQAPDPSIRSDNHLWLPMLVSAILAETGDPSLLARKVPFLGEDGKPAPAAPETRVWDHLLAAVRFTESHLGSHGIPLILASDWNDLIGKFAKQGRGETTFAAFQYVHVLKLLLQMSGLVNDAESAAWLSDCLSRQQAALAACAWDGKWWRRGFDDDGNPIGSVEEAAERIYLNPQSWAVIAGFGSPEQRAQGMEEACRRLDLGYGLKLLDPAFTGWDGGDSLVGYGPGCGENGAVFCHANTWAILAEALLGNSERAWKYFTQLMPQNVIEKLGLDTYRAEPYAWVSNIVGPGNGREGWGNVEHISGTAAWMDIAATQYLLGIRPELNGLRLSPCLPGDWKQIEVQRDYRGCRVQFRINNRKGDGKTVRGLRIDGELLEMSCGEPLISELYLQGKTSARIDLELGRG